MRQLAAPICILFIFYLFWRDRKEKDAFSSALWIPLSWMFIAGSRYPSQWLELRGGTMGYAMKYGVDAYVEGSPFDAVIFFGLIAAGVIVLMRRKVDWGLALAQNKCIWIYLLYCGISIAWSDFPFVALKRWIKELGTVVMMLVILTDKRPYEAINVILKRLAFIWLPLSVLFIRFYGDWGRAYHMSGEVMYRGVGNQKNDLGLICLFSMICLMWNFLMNRKGGAKARRADTIIDLVLLGMAVWLLHLSNSATAMSCSVFAMTLLFMGRAKLIAQEPDRIMVILIVAAPLLFLLDSMLGLKETALDILGREATLTARVPIWELLREKVVDPVFGAGYNSFWLGDRMKSIWIQLGQPINQAHNGYLEQYLNLGYIGVAFIGAILLSGLLKVRRYLKVDYPAAVLRLCFIAVALLYNYTEASLCGINNVWLAFLFAVTEMPGPAKPAIIGQAMESRLGTKK